jgi:serine/threonine-protein kinase RsbW
MTGNGPPGWHQHVLRTSCELRGPLQQLLDAMRGHGYDPHALFGVRLALEEAVVNAIKHGHRGDTAKTVHVRYQLCERQLLVEVQDEGPGFDPEGLPDPLAPENLERPGGRGVFLIRHYMTWVAYNDSGNCVTMCKTREPSAARA